METNGDNVTIDQLARMVAKGFEETAKAKEVNEHFNKVEERLDRIEKFLLEEHRRRIERLENEMKEVRNALAMK
ncbi:MAG TPA: hypothetical protein VGA53_03500 [Candidatus Paceibacterota bacterium]